MRQTPESAFHGEFTSADAQTAAAISLYLGAQASAYTLQDTDRVVVTDLLISSLTALTLTVFVDTDADAAVDAGEKIAVVNCAANSQPINLQFQTPRVCPAGKTLKVKASGAGQVDVILNGYISGPGGR